MGALYLDGVLQPDPMPCRLPDELSAAFQAEASQQREEQRARCERLDAEIGARMDTAAVSAIDLMMDARARRFRQRPSYLENPQAELSTATPKALVARTSALIEQAERGDLPRWYGFGGESVDINLHAARLYGERMLAHETAARAAQSEQAA